MLEDQEFNRKVDERIRIIVPQMLKSSSFIDRKLTDMPTDSLQVTSRKYVNLFGTTAERPQGQIRAQQYFDTSIGRPVFFNPNSSVWTDAAGSVS